MVQAVLNLEPEVSSWSPAQSTVKSKGRKEIYFFVLCGTIC